MSGYDDDVSCRGDDACKSLHQKACCIQMEVSCGGSNATRRCASSEGAAAYTCLLVTCSVLHLNNVHGACLYVYVLCCGTTATRRRAPSEVAVAKCDADDISDKCLPYLAYEASMFSYCVLTSSKNSGANAQHEGW